MLEAAAAVRPAVSCRATGLLSFWALLGRRMCKRTGNHIHTHTQGVSLECEIYLLLRAAVCCPCSHPAQLLLGGWVERYL